MALKQVKNFDEFKEELSVNKSLQDQFKADPVAAVNQINQLNPLTADVWIYRIIVLALGLTILSIIIGVIVLIGTGQIQDDKGVPTILTAIGSAAIGAVAGLLAPPPKSN
jgi:hypothetical protein